MKSFVKPRTRRQIVFKTWFPLVYNGKTYNRYCTYGKRFTKDYLHCLLLGHGLVHTDVSVGSRGLQSILIAICCDRTYLPVGYKEE